MASAGTKSLLQPEFAIVRGGLSNFIPQEQRYLRIDYQRDSDQITEPGLGKLIYNRDCSGALELALGGSAGAQFAPVTLQAAARSALSRNFSARVRLSKGDFVSPIPKQWRGEIDAENRAPMLKFYTALLFWDWYKRNGTNGGPYKLLNSTSGISLYRFKEDQSSTANTASAKVNLAIPFLSVKFKGGGKIEGDSSLSLENFRFARLEAPADVIGDYTTPQEFPEIEEVLSVISNSGSKSISLRLAKGENDIVRAGTTKNFELDIEALPFRYCSREMILTGSSTEFLKLGTPSRQEQPNGIPICRFPLRYTVPNSSQNNILNFALTQSAIGLPEGVAPFQIPVFEEFRRSDRPRISELAEFASESSITSAGDPSTTKLSWVSKGRLLDDGLIDDKNDIDRSKFGAIDCPSDPRRTDVFKVSHDIGSRTNDRERPITFTIDTSYNNLAPDWEQNFIVCRIAGSISYETSQGSIPQLLDGFYIRVPSPLAFE